MTASKDRPKPATPEDLKRREVKRLQQLKKLQGPKTAQTTRLFEGINTDRAARRAARNDPEAQRAFGLLHGALAIEHPAITRLRVNSPEWKIAIEAISLYPSVTRTKTRGRCDVAVDTALRTPELLKYANDKHTIKYVRSIVKRAFEATNLLAQARNEALGNP
jgi:hypothetical protein